MRLGRVVGAVWGGKEAASLGQRKLLQVQPVKLLPGTGAKVVEAGAEDQELSGGLVVALDMLGAGIGEYVLIAHGSRVRDLTIGPDLPTKDVVIAIVDSCHVDRELLTVTPQEAA